MDTIARVERVFLLAGIAVVVCGFGCGSSDKPAKEFEDIRQLVCDGHYQEAIPPLQSYLTTYPKSVDASRAGLFLGKAYLGLGRFDEAKAAFTQTTRGYPDTLEAHKSRYKLAFIELVEGDWDEAAKMFGALADSPDGPLAPEAAAIRDYLIGKEPAAP